MTNDDEIVAQLAAAFASGVAEGSAPAPVPAPTAPVLDLWTRPMLRAAWQKAYAIVDAHVETVARHTLASLGEPDDLDAVRDMMRTLNGDGEWRDDAAGQVLHALHTGFTTAEDVALLFPAGVPARSGASAS